MNISYDKTATLRSQTKHHEPIVLVYDARGNGDGETAPTITGDHQNRVTDYTAIAVERRRAVSTIVFDESQITSKYNYSHPKANDPCHPLTREAGRAIVAIEYDGE